MFNRILFLNALFICILNTFKIIAKDDYNTNYFKINIKIYLQIFVMYLS